MRNGLFSLLHLASYVAASILIGTTGTSRAAGTDRPVLSSAGAISFDGGNVLFVSDNKSGRVHAFELPASEFANQAGVSMGRPQTFEGKTLVDNIYASLGQLLEAEADDILVNDMAVHRPSRQVFFSVDVGRGPKPIPAIVKLNDGELQLVDLSAAKQSSIALTAAAKSGTLEFGQLQNSLAMTDIDYFQGELFVAGLSTGTFASKLRRIKFPFDGKVSTTSIEIWHAVHAQFETRAPIVTQDIQVIDGTPTLIAVYACTPLVRIPISDLKDGAKIRGEMIGELGYGNTPIDILTYKDGVDGNDYVLVTHTNRSATRIALKDIATAAPMPVNVGNNFGPAGVKQFPIPVTDAVQIARIDDQWAVALRKDPHGSRRYELHTLPLPFFFDRSDHIVEMNWPGSPDPFGYNKYR